MPEIFKLTVPKATRARIRGVPVAPANKTLKVHVPCRRRAKLYAAELVAAHAALRAMSTAGSPHVVNQRLWYALSGERIVDLLESLAEILDDYVAFGVQADFAVGGVGAADPDYNTYCDNRIDAVGGVAAFLGRYPLLQSAITTLRGYFVANIREACGRINTDWAEIEAAFVNTGAGDALRALVKFTTTGSDFHKHGKQVIILTFAYTAAAPPALALARRRTGRLVTRAITKRTGNALAQRPYLVKVIYKPTDIEIDARIMGNTAAMNAARGAAGFVAAENPVINQSLMEVMNGILALAPADVLPTYTILPHNPGSSLGGAPLPIGTSYGYIQFLTHEPAVNWDGQWNEPNAVAASSAQAQTACNSTPGWQGAFDWVTHDPNVVTRCFETWGRLAAIAVVFSIADMHVQNVILHGCKPHLIDLEDSVKWRMNAVGQTGMFGGTTPSCDNLRGPNPLFNIKANDKTTTLLCGPLPGEPRLSATVLFHKPGGGAPARAARGGNQANMHNGFIQVFNAVGNPIHNATLRNWAANDLPNVITRYVAIPTGDYYDQLANFVLRNLTVAPPVPGAAVNFQNYNNWFFEIAVQSLRTTWNQIVRAVEPEEIRQWRSGHLPTFALHDPDDNFRDIVSWDIPSFYRRLGTDDLLGSTGVVVDPGAANTWQDNQLGVRAIATGVAAVAVPLATHFANEPAAAAAALAASPGAINVPAQLAVIPAAISDCAAAQVAVTAAIAVGQPVELAAQGAAALMGATPQTVAAAAAAAAAPIAAAARLQHFFPETAVAMVVRQIQALQDIAGPLPSPARTTLQGHCLASIV